MGFYIACGVQVCVCVCVCVCERERERESYQYYHTLTALCESHSLRKRFRERSAHVSIILPGERNETSFSSHCVQRRSETPEW